MGIGTALRLVQGISPLEQIAAPSARRAQPTAPWSEGALAQIIAGDLFGTAAIQVTRTEAMTVPAVVNARWLIANPLARQPLRAFRGETPTDTPAWLYRTSGQTSPQMRILWTLDDLLFTGYSLWARHNGAAGEILEVERIARERWDFTPNWDIEVDGEPATNDQVILFTSPMDPLLECAARTIRAARNIEEAWAARVRDPIPVMAIKQTEDIELDAGTQELSEAQELVNAYVAARKTATGAVVFVPYGYDLQAIGEAAVDLYVEGRNAVALDIGRFCALPPQLLGASQVAASLTYSTREGARSDFQDYSLAGWAMAIESRLSMDDVVPRGTSIRFDLSNLNTPTTPATGPTTED